MAQINIALYGFDVKLMFSPTAAGTKAAIEKSCSQYGVDKERLLDLSADELGQIIRGQKWNKQDMENYFRDFQKEAGTGWGSNDDIADFVSIKIDGRQTKIDKEKIKISMVKAASQPQLPSDQELLVLTTGFLTGTTDFYIINNIEEPFDESKITLFIKDFSSIGSDRKIIEHVEYDGKVVEYFKIF